ncbi:MAG TPA: hypothetical protein VLN56_09820 [Gammaproteobacteria bacterium]|nr:hypothetical protein [Gammaproteobacteria bacterium]
MKPELVNKIDKPVEKYLDEARTIVEHLHALLHEDAMHRLKLYQKYAYDPNSNKWSPDLYRRCQLVDALRNKLNGYNEIVKG